MDYQFVASQMARARKVFEDWNMDHSPREIPWEWVEEMMLAKHRWHDLARQRKGTSLDQYARYQEFSKKLPRPLVDRIFEVCK